MNEKYTLTREEINQCLLNSPYALPSSPASSGLGAGQIKKYFYQFIEYLASKLNIHLEEIGVDYEALQTVAKEDIPRLEDRDEEIKRELMDTIEVHNAQGSGSHSDIRELVSTIKDLATSAYNLASGKAKIYPTFGYPGVASLLNDGDLHVGDMIILGEKNLPELMVYSIGEESSEGDVAFGYMEMVSGQVKLSPGCFYYFEKRKTRLLAIEGGLDASMFATKTDVEERTGELPLIKTVTLGEPSGMVHISFDTPLKEFFLVFEGSADVTETASRTFNVRTDGGSLYFYAQSVKFEPNTVKKLVSYSRELAERYWISLTSPNMESDMKGNGTAQAYITPVYRKTEYSRYVTEMDVFVRDTSISGGSVIKIYGREVKE